MRLLLTVLLVLTPTAASVLKLFFHPNEPNVSEDVCLNKGIKCPEDSQCCRKANGRLACCPVSQHGVMCPDGQSECAVGQTCCILASGRYGCCPLPMAVCCTDHKHCCPHSTQCDVSSGKCLRQDGSLEAWFEKVPSTEVKVEAVKCSDGRSECKTGQTCCKLSSGQYGCCPLPKAVCCSDGRHCCPSGTKCEVSSGKCLRQDGSLEAWFEKVPSTEVKVEAVKCSDGRSECKTGQTCCKLSSGQYGCCPLPKAVCCSDGRHCCPSGTKCEVSSGKCLRQDGSLEAWFEKVPSTEVKVEAVKCSDGRSECKTGQTCCKLSSGQFGCCPLPKAVCCSDGRHCCPSGTKCEVSSGKCLRQDGSLEAWFEKVPSTEVKVEAVKCSDGRSECKTGQTCCKLSSGQFGCCPLPEAVCCSDGRHCCPSGTKCEVSSGKCLRQDGSLEAWFEKVPSTEVKVEAVNCSDGRSECKTGQTCCKLSSGQFGCCPLPEAVCCSDGRHCCPSGTKCEVSSGKCLRQDGSLEAWFEKVPSTEVKVEAVKCSDGRSECKTGQTCCKLSSGQYGCCPLPKAVCCSDGRHCCPSGTKCEVSSGKCLRQDGSLEAWFEKVPSTEVKVEAVKCSDGRSECKTGQTCCKLSSGQYGCCPLPKAVCCSDGRHCCPSGTKCEVSSGKCLRQDGSLEAWFEKVPSTEVKVEAVKCSDGRSECKTGQTCCKLSSGQFGCCPLPEAVCCSDGRHCCPSGTKCEVSSGKCLRQDGSLEAWFEKVPSTEVKVEAVKCSDGRSECKTGQTCCKLSSGEFGCCPLPEAVCCSDGRHCCPSGTKCEVSSGKCLRQDGSLEAWFEKVPSTEVKVEAVKCSDGRSECKTGQTCCKLSSGEYGCCPLPKAVCCSDGRHCCPSGTKCEVSSGKCLRQDGSVEAWFEKVPSTEVKVEAVKCPDGRSECKTGQTCCKLSSGQFGCCPLPKAVCCSDGRHCCPSGTKCEVSSGKCLRQDGSLEAWFEKVPSTEVKVEAVKCSDGRSECKTGQTCCKLSSGLYGCCPLPEAVCCSDRRHCCPSGTKCEVSSGKCLRQDGSLEAWFEKVPSTEVKVEAVKCSDGRSECKTGQTCCKLSSGQFGCCPLPKAVCCSDGRHCCPSGTKCEVSSGKCLRQDGSLEAWFEKVPSTEVKVEAVKCSDGRSECKTGQTCCKLSSGLYGCCPLPKAVCCSDGRHCCPSGTKCEVSSGKCLRQDGSLEAWLEKVPSTEVKVENVICPDGQSECQTGQTCCKTTSGAYGCCPLPNAMCCSDGIHCCPSGDTCELSHGTCKNGLTSTPWFTKEPAKVKVESPVSVECPGKTSECPANNTCCSIGDSKYGCCPLPQAVCCTDKKHCCPAGYKCSATPGTCTRNTDNPAWLDPRPAVTVTMAADKREHKLAKTKKVSSTAVKCPDGSNCPSDNKCCQTKAGGYACCAYGNGVCCSNADYCCPHKYICDEQPMICRMPDNAHSYQDNLLIKNIRLRKPN